MKTVINITTIHTPYFLETLCGNIKLHSREVEILIIGDFKTPSIKSYCAEVQKKYGVPIEYLDLEGQEETLKKLLPRDYINLMELFPVNTPDRIILGNVIAYLRGAERVIAVDDDNFPTDYDFIGYHEIVGTEKDVTLVSGSNGWFNVHSVLCDEVLDVFYPRGFPWKYRVKNEVTSHKGKRKVVVNQGLVLGDPDIDAIQRLSHKVHATKMKDIYGKQFSLDINTWSPFNYQNTCISRELIPCYYRPRSTSRNADIWTAYLFNKLAHHFGHVISFGQPLVVQERNAHNLWTDLDTELINNKATDIFVDLLRKVRITKDNYFDALCEVITNYPLPYSAGLKEADMIKGFITEYAVWCNVMGEIK